MLAGPDGVLMVDSQFAPLTERIVAAIKAIDPGPIRYLINTHVHGDHTGGNANLAAMGVTIIARPQLRARLEKPSPTATGAPGTPAPAAALPRLTYDAPMTFHMNGEQVQLVPIPSAHTDGDTLVKFVNADVIMTGDFYRSLGYPNIDRANGGTLNGMLAGLNKIIELVRTVHQDPPRPRRHRRQNRRRRAQGHPHRRARQDRADGEEGHDGRAGDRGQADVGLRCESARHRHDRRSVCRAVVCGVERSEVGSFLRLTAETRTTQSSVQRLCGVFHHGATEHCIHFAPSAREHEKARIQESGPDFLIFAPFLLYAWAATRPTQSMRSDRDT